MCDKKPCDKCCHDEDLICCMPLVHCCGGYSEHNNCCPHNRCCNSCCGGCGCCDDCCECCYCKYYKLLRELKDRLENAENRITNLESQLENSIEYLKKYIDKKYNDILISVPCSVSYKIVDGVKTFVYTRFTDDQGNTEDVKITDINQIRDDLALDYMNDVLSYSGFSSFPVNGEYNGAPDVIYIDEGLNKIYWYNKNASGTGRDKYQLLASTDYDDLGDKPKLNTNNSSNLSTSSSEIIQGTINLHKISKTGKFSDITIDSPNGFVKNVSVYSDTYSPDANGLVDIPALVKGVKVGNGNARYPNSSGIVTINTSDLPADIDTKNTAGAQNNESDTLFIVGASQQTANPVTNTNENCYIQNNYLYSNKKKVLTTADQPDLSPYALKAEMSITPGTGSSSDKTTIQLKNGTSTTVLTEHQDISDKANKSDAIGKVTFDRTTGDLKFYSIASPNSNPLYTINLLWKEDSTNNNITYTSGTSKSVTAGGFYDNTVS